MLPVASKVLVVDDMPTLRDLVKQQLRLMGYANLVEAADGEQALKLMQQADASNSKVEFVVADWNMPKMSGLELLKEVRAQAKWANLPFVLLTSESERDNVTEAILAGVSQYIVKPFTPKSFEEKLKTAWSKHNK